MQTMGEPDVPESATMPRSGAARMRPRARLIALLGDELVSDERVAVVELVKNAYVARQGELDLDAPSSLLRTLTCVPRSRACRITR